MVVKVIDNEGDVQELYVNRMTDISTAVFAIMKTFQEEVKIDEVLDENKQLHERVYEAEEFEYSVNRALEDTAFDSVDELVDAYDEAVKVLKDINSMTEDF